jgi:hypothetical protein
METVVNTVVGIIIGSMLAIGAVNVGELLAQILIRRDARKRNRG